MSQKNQEAKEFAIEAAKIAISRHCKDVSVVDLKGMSPATDFFVIATSTSAIQGRSIADEINDYGKKHGFPRFGRAGYELGKWVLIDFVDVVVHIFDEDYRDYYDLEVLWGDGENVEFDMPDITND